MKKVVCGFLLAVCVAFSLTVFASQEGTRHITGDKIDVYFMNDKLFGHIHGHPLWAIYNCGSDIKGEIDINGKYHAFEMVYHKQGDRILTGTVGDSYVALGAINRTPDGFLYQVFVKEKEYAFSIKYERMESDHLVNSVIEGEVGNGKKVKLTVDGHLCPFATTGIIVITAGTMLLT